MQAAAALFGSNAGKVIVRLPESGDDAIRKEQNNSVVETKAAPQEPEAEKVVSQKPALPEEPEITISEEKPVEVKQQNIPEENDIPAQETLSKPAPRNMNSTASSFHSDEVNMVMDLFEGKLIE